MKAAARAAVYAFGDAVPVLIENMKDIIPDSKERKEFSNKVVEEFKSEKYNFSYCTYENVFEITLIIGL